MTKVVSVQDLQARQLAELQKHYKTSKQLREDYDFSNKANQLIGTGSFSKVYCCSSTSTNEKVAIKKVAFQQMDVGSFRNFFFRELPTWSQISHSNVLKLIEIYLGKKHAYLVTEYCKNGDLLKYIKAKWQGKINEEYAVLYMKQIVAGMQELVKVGMMHRDIKPENILVCDDEKSVKVGDFGFVKDASEIPMKHSVVGTPLYMSPQCLSNISYSNKSDIWSLGIMFYELMCGQTPWENAKNNNQLLGQICETKKINFGEIQVSKPIKRIISGCLKIQEEKRYTFKKLELKLQEALANFEEKTITPEQDEKETNQQITIYNNNSQTLEIRKNSKEVSPSNQSQENQYKKIIVEDNNNNININLSKIVDLPVPKEKEQYQDFHIKLKSVLYQQFQQQNKSNINAVLKHQESLENLQKNQWHNKTQSPSTYKHGQVNRFEENWKLPQIEVLVQCVEILNFTCSVSERIVILPLSSFFVLKAQFLIKKMAMSFSELLYEIFYKKENSLNINDFQGFVDSQSFQSNQIMFNQMYYANFQDYKLIYDQIQNKNNFRDNMLADESMKNLYSFDFSNQPLNEFTNYLIEFLVSEIRELNHEMRKYFNNKKENNTLSKEEKHLVLFLASLIDCHQILIRIHRLEFNFLSLLKEVQLDSVFTKHTIKFVDSINLDYFKFLRKNIFDLQI